ncbi:hypothetical protein EIL50_05405 [bacterium NHP-B]|nr:hypothetical protein EIL50_05405 [bacterium NHP-B]
MQNLRYKTFSVALWLCGVHIGLAEENPQDRNKPFPATHLEPLVLTDIKEKKPGALHVKNPTSVGASGFYGGLGLGGMRLSGTRDVFSKQRGMVPLVAMEGQSFTGDGFVIEGLVGYRQYIDDVLLGGECTFGWSTASHKAQKEVLPGAIYTSTLSQKGLVGVGFLAGYVLSWCTPFTKIGAVLGRFCQETKSDRIIAKVSDTRLFPGLAASLGIEKMWGRWGARLAYDFAVYASLTSTRPDALYPDYFTITQKTRSLTQHKVMLSGIMSF